jgi:hypothetical protein
MFNFLKRSTKTTPELEKYWFEKGYDGQSSRYPVLDFIWKKNQWIWNNKP